MLLLRNRKKNGRKVDDSSANRLHSYSATSITGDCIPYTRLRGYTIRAYTLYASAEGALNRQITFTHAADFRLFSRVAREFDIALGAARVYKDLLKSKTPHDIEILKNKSFRAL